jgi:enamine deaminase RidA (YjgF/YER057c/UK114 family)
METQNAARFDKNKKAQRDAVFPADPNPLYETYGYSAAIRSENLLFVSGQVGKQHFILIRRGSLKRSER